jgi:hypothetical protein
MWICWQSIRDEPTAKFGTAIIRRSRLLFHLVVERHVGSLDWSWVAWCADNPEMTPWHGEATSSGLAKAAAEHAVRVWKTECPWARLIGRVPPSQCEVCDPRLCGSDNSAALAMRDCGGGPRHRRRFGR